MSSSPSCSEDKLATDAGSQDTRIQNLANQVKQKHAQTWSDMFSSSSNVCLKGSIKTIFDGFPYLQIEKQTVGVKENSEALKGITKDSIGE